ncbi:MAG: LuxR C-terminal-related transcriptional regulator [Pseudomonadota bacterium]
MSGAESFSELSSDCLRPMLDAFGADSLIFLSKHHSFAESQPSAVCYVNQTDTTVRHYLAAWQDRDPVVSHWRERQREHYSVFRFSDICAEAGERRLGGFRSFLDSSGVQHMLVMSFAMGAEGKSSALMALHRRPGGADFVEADRDMANSVAPVLRQVLRGIARSPLDAESAGTFQAIVESASNHGMALIDCSLSVLASNRLARQSGLLRGDGQLTPQTHARVAKVVNAIETGNAPATDADGYIELDANVSLRIVDPLNGLAVLRHAPSRDVRPVDQQLTPRQAQVSSLVAQGLRNWQIAEALGVSENTVVNHLSAIYDKLGLSGRTALALQWRGDPPKAPSSD